MTRSPALVVTGIGASVVLATGVATAVSRSHHDATPALPAVCRDTAGSTGGALPNGRLLDLALGNALRDGSAGRPKSLAQNAGSAAFGAGSDAEIEARAKALTGAGGGSGAGAAAPALPPTSAAPQRQGDEQGGGGGSGGPGGAGTGNGSGPSTGGGGGIGAEPQTGSGAGHQPGQPLPATRPRTPGREQAAPAEQRSQNDVGAWVVVALLVALAALLGAWWWRRGRRRVSDAVVIDAGLDATGAAARALAARRRNDLDAALRWTFVAGLLRLDDAGVMPFDPARTTRAIGRRLRSRVFDDLAIAFDRVAYGGRRATEADVDGAVHGWDRLLLETRRAWHRA